MFLICRDQSFPPNIYIYIYIYIYEQSGKHGYKVMWVPWNVRHPVKARKDHATGSDAGNNDPCVLFFEFPICFILVQ